MNKLYLKIRQALAGKTSAGARAALAAVAIATAATARAGDTWTDITQHYVTNPGFDSNSNAGWTVTSDAGSKAVRCECMEFWNGTFDIHQTLKGLPAGKYRLSVQAFYRTQDNSKALREHQQGTESITAVMYAGATRQKLASLFSFHFTSEVYGCWSPNGTDYYPNTMEGSRTAFDRGQYWNTMEFTATGGDVAIGLANDTYIYSNWCIFDNFRLERWGEPVKATEVSVRPSAVQMVAGETVQLAAEVQPADVTVNKVVWTSSDSRVASVDSDGRLTALGGGTATVTATAADGSGASGTVAVTVSDSQATASSLVINEVMAANIDEYVSPAFNFDGWIELYNPSDRKVSLKGLYVTDDTDSPRKWQLGARHGIIQPRGFALLWFDSNSLNASNAPFKLDTDGGTIRISNGSGETVGEVTYPAAVERASFARTTDGGSEWGWTASPSPGRTNTGSPFATRQLDAPAPSKDSQLFESTLSTSVSNAERATLRYTTDGTLPTMENGMTSDDGLFTFSKTTCLRLRFFKEGMLPSKVTTRSYILRDKDYRLPVVSVVSDPRFLYDDSIGVMVRGVNGLPGNGQSTPCNWNMDWDRPVNFSYILEDGTMALNQDVNLEMAGGWSRAWEPHSFKLKGNKELSGNKHLNHPFFAAKPYIRNRTLQIRNGGNDTDCRFKDAAVETIIQTSGIDIDVQSYQPVHEFVNGKYMGVLNMREPNNKHYVYANYGWDDDEIDQFEMNPDSGYVQKCGTDEAFNRLCDLSAKAAQADAYEEIKAMLDIDEYVNYMAMELYIGSTDWPQNNIKGFRPAAGGKFRFVSFDLDFAFNTSNTFETFANKQTYTFDYLYNLDTRYTKEIKMVTLFMNLLANGEFRRKFIDTYCMMGGSVFETERAKAVIDSLERKVTPMMALEGKSPAKSAEQLRSGFSNRMGKMADRLQEFAPMALGGATQRTARIRTNTEGAQLMVNGTVIPTGSFNGRLFAPARLKAVAPTGYRFLGWRDKTDNTIHTKEAEITMPTDNFDLEAVFTKMGKAERKAKGITPVRINEISAASGAFVNDHFKKSAWVELYNTTGAPLDVEGMYISDNPAKPKKCKITKGEGGATTVIPANGHLLVWCDKREPAGELHASFKLDEEGGSVTITAADESWADTLSYPPHSGSTTAGRYPDGADNTYLMANPTIGKANRLTSYLVAYDNSLPSGIAGTPAAAGAGTIRLAPALNRVVVRSGSASTATVTVSNLSGQTVANRKVTLAGGEASVSTDGLPAGCYIARATDGNGHTATMKFAK